MARRARRPRAQSRQRPTEEVTSLPVPATGALDRAPRVGLAAAERIAREHFGIDGRASALTSERDQNFLIRGGDGTRIVLKIANAAEQKALLEAQQRAITHLAQRLDVTPRVLSTVNGRALVEIAGTEGNKHWVWAISWLPGIPLANAARRSSALHEDLGRQIGALQRELLDFDHPALHRDFYWDLANARSIVADKRALVDDGSLRAAIDRVVAEFDKRVAPALAHVRRAIIHNDLNDHNILVGGADDLESRGQSISGIVDFGDMVYSYRVGELAIAIAYAILDREDPLNVAAAIVRGYCERSSLDDHELASLFGLVLMRLCASACIAAEQQRQQPDNVYLGVSQQAIRRILPKLASVPFCLAQTMLREAAGAVPSPKAAHVRDYLNDVAEFAPVIGIDLEREASLVLDLSAGSPMVSGDWRENQEPALSERVFGAMKAAGVRVGVGRYNEPRLLYVAPGFSGGARPTDPHRTIHIGLDLFAPPGTPVFAPLDATVHAFADIALPLDYGPVIILRHTTDDGVEFFTLYGHLSRESLAGLEIGKTLNRGDQFATLGDPSVNGGWSPHLHLQIITDLLGLGTDFPGVAYASQRNAWVELCPDPNLITRIPKERFPAASPSKVDTVAGRRARIGRNLSVAYRDPVKTVRGWKQYLYDDTGRCFIDAYNNVPHVGHCHPRVVEAAALQMRVLNTNTRYLNDLLATYAERLLATMPAPLEVCYFVNSASEANELALRLARAYTSARDTIVLEAAYHGNTTSLIDISPYKHAGPGGKGAPDWVHVAPLPDVYRGPIKKKDAHAGEKYAAKVRDLVAATRSAGRRIAAFIAETCPSVGGQLVFPKDYLTNVYQHVRSAGGVCIADEVQTGLGRMGTSRWAFEDQHVVPDIVVMGKPLGNGHPIGAVATTRSIAEAFDNGMEFFSTFGGNTVSCAVGIAVLDVLREEGLQEHARKVGERLLGGLKPMVEQHAIVGDVRGSGLFLGVELVRDRETLVPADAEAAFVVNRMRERGVLAGTDGPHHNVVKIRPPMPFDENDADVLLEVFEAGIRELPGH
jgi:4-aminobutyrate aminotransferase-like enzyme/Ser/Thr protein kinase RdoA (MazF antagonist)